MLINKFHEDPKFKVIHSINKFRISFWGYYPIFHLFIIIFHLSVTESTNLERFRNLARTQNASIRNHHYHGRRNRSEIPLSINLNEKFNSLDFMNDSSFFTASDEMENIDDESIYFAPADSSKQKSMVTDFDLQSSFIEKNNNKSFQIDNSIIMPFLNAFNSTNIETQQPETYYDYLYELAMNMSHLHETNTDDLQCNKIFNSSLKDSIFKNQGRPPNMEKP